LRRRWKYKGYVELSLGDFLPLIFGNFSTGDLYKVTASPTKLEELEKMIMEFTKETDGVSLVTTIGAITAVTEAELLAKSIIYIYEINTKALDILDIFIKIEFSKCIAVETLFRGNSFTTKLFKFYCKIVGLPYLFHTFAGNVFEICSAADPDNITDSKSVKMNSISENSSQPPNLRLDTTVIHSFHIDVELDPSKMSNIDDEDVNTYTLLLYSQKILSSIFKSAAFCPLELRKFFQIVQKHVHQYFPGNENKSIGAFYFLRFTCSAISVPESYGLVKVPPSRAARRNLVLITKVLQNLANEVAFGKKESYMVKMNDFINSNIPKLAQFYEMLLKIPEDQPPTQPVEITAQVKNNSLAFIYNHICQIKSKIDSYLTGDKEIQKRELHTKIEKLIKEIGEPFEKSINVKSGKGDEL